MLKEDRDLDIQQCCGSPDCREKVHPLTFWRVRAGTHSFRNQPLVMLQKAPRLPGVVTSPPPPSPRSILAY